MKKTAYVAKKPDQNGYITYEEQEHAVWSELIQQQMAVLPNRACNEYIEGLEKLNLPLDNIPQLQEINSVLESTTGWSVVAVPALISFDRFFKLLSQKQFPVATFIRSKEEFEYLQEPDIFHEIFGHCPLLTNPSFAAFTHAYGKLGYAASKEDRVFLARLYWMTVEFGLIQTDAGLRIYGGGILSSPGESVYALESKIPLRKPLDPVEALRTPYRIDIMQPIYYVIDNMSVLDDLSAMDIMSLVAIARKKGMKTPLFTEKSSM